MPLAAQWGLALVILLLVGAMGTFTPWGAGNVTFVLGAACILASLGFVRLGGDRTIVGRTLQGEPLWDVDTKKRGKEIQRGVALFLLGLALWGALGVSWAVRR